MSSDKRKEEKKGGVKIDIAVAGANIEVSPSDIFNFMDGT
jgi:hypothetical protein